jgi:hypothetical protein
MHLRSVPAFQKAVDDSDSYAMYMIAKEEHTRSSSFAVAQNVFQQLLSIKMDGTFSKLAFFIVVVSNFSVTRYH